MRPRCGGVPRRKMPDNLEAAQAAIRQLWTDIEGWKKNWREARQSSIHNKGAAAKLEWSNHLPTEEGNYLFYGWRRAEDNRKQNRIRSTWCKKAYDPVPPRLGYATINKGGTGSLIYVVHSDFEFQPQLLWGMWARLEDEMLPDISHLSWEEGDPE